MKASYLSTGQAAKLLSVTPDTVLKWIKSGKLSAHFTAGGHCRIHPGELERLKISNQTVPLISKVTFRKNNFMFCWEYNNAGVVSDRCGECIVYKTRAQRCYELAKLGTALAGMGDLAQSAEAFKRATEIHPGFADARYRLGLSLQRMERLDEAAKSYAAAISIQPDLAPALASLGSIRAAEGRFDEAEALLRRALEADPNHATARNYLEQLQELQESE